MSTYFVHAFVDGAISSSLVLCVQLTIVSITKSQPCLALCTMLDLFVFLEYFNGNQNSSFCCLHLCYFCFRTSMPRGGVHSPKTMPMSSAGDESRSVVLLFWQRGNFGGHVSWFLNVRHLTHPIPCLMPSNILPFYVTAETGPAECPGSAALSSL